MGIWSSSIGRQEPGKEPGAASKVLLSATSEMDIWKGEVESGDDVFCDCISTHIFSYHL